MEHVTPPGFKILESPRFEFVLRQEVTKCTCEALLTRLRRHLASNGFFAEDWGTNPVFIANPDGWLMPADQMQIQNWLLAQEECLRLIVEYDKNPRRERMLLGFLNFQKQQIDLQSIQST